MKLSSKQIGLMLERSSKLDRKKNSFEMNDRYYRILYFYQKRKQEESKEYINKPVVIDNSYNKIIIGKTTTTWDNQDKKMQNHVLNMMSKTSN